jgi:hypothetical protein
MTETVAKRLGNTQAVCRRCDIYPAIIEEYEGGKLREVRGGAEAAVLLLPGRTPSSGARSESRRSSPRYRSAGRRR